MQNRLCKIFWALVKSNFSYIHLHDFLTSRSIHLNKKFNRELKK